MECENCPPPRMKCFGIHQAQHAIHSATIKAHTFASLHVFNSFLIFLASRLWTIYVRIMKEKGRDGEAGVMNFFSRTDQKASTRRGNNVSCKSCPVLSTKQKKGKIFSS